jgi:UDP-N-acetylglucosamine 1-carboxyvinyltransferase
MEKFVIEGGVPLCGAIRPAGNKNAALPLLASSLLTDEQVVLHNVPQIRDVEAMLALLADLGVEVDRRDGSTVALRAASIRTTQADPVLAERIRASVLVGGPLLARCGEALLPPPGGDVIGRRRLDPHLDAFRALGAQVEHGRDIRLSAPDGGLVAGDFFMDEPSVMGTENALMAAALTPGTTIIRNAASEPHVQDLARMLNRMGAAITGIGSNVMEVHGADRLGGCEHTVSPDHIEIASFMALAGVTGGELRIEGCVADDLRMIRLVFGRLGLRSDLDGDDVVVPGDQKLVMARDHGGYQIKVEDGPWPAFPADLTSIAVALATQSEGTVLLF